MAEKDLTARVRVEADDARSLDEIEESLRALDPAGQDAADGLEKAARESRDLDSELGDTNMSLEEAVRIFLTYQARLREAAQQTRKAGQSTKRLGRDFKTLRGNLRRANSALVKFIRSGRGLAALRKSFTNLTGNLKAEIIQRLGQAFQDAVRTIADFSEQMSAVQAVTRANDEQMKALTATAREMGSTTKFSATEAAEGMEFLARAGFDVDEVLTAIPSTLRLAQAGALDLADAADIASNILSAFGENASQLPRVGDAIAETAANSNTNILQMGEAMKKVGPIASALGISVEDTAAAIGVLANAGIQGEAGGTALKTILASLVSPSNEARGAIEGLGLSMDQVDPKSHSLADVVSTLASAGLDAGDAFKIFGKEGAPAILALTGQTSQLEDLTEKVNDSSGAMERMSKVMGDNLAGSIKEFKSAGEGAVLTIGDGLSPALRTLLGDATDTARGLDEEFSVLGKSLGTVLLAIGAFVDGVKAGFSAIAGVVGIGISTLAEGLANVGQLIADALGKIGFDELASNLRSRLETVETVAAEFRSNVEKDTLGDLEKARDNLREKIDTLVDIWKEGGRKTKEASKDFKDAAANVNELGETAKETAGDVETSTEKMGDALSEVGSRTQEAIADVKRLFGELPEDARENAQALKEAWETFDPNDVRQRFAVLDDETQEEIRSSFSEAVETIRASGGEISEEMALIGNSIGVLTSAFEPVGSAAAGAADAVSSSADQISDSITVVVTKYDEAGKKIQTVEQVTREAARRMTLEEIEQADPRLQEYVKRLKETEEGLGQTSTVAQETSDSLSEPAQKVEEVSQKVGDLASSSKTLAEAQEGAGQAAKDQASSLGELAKALTSEDLSQSVADLAAQLEGLNQINLGPLLSQLDAVEQKARSVAQAVASIDQAADGASVGEA